MRDEELLAAFNEIAHRRGWQSLHTPKNLAMALSVEVAELSRHLQWRDDGEIAELVAGPDRAAVAAELADIRMYLVKLADALGVDMEAALRDKIAENRQRCDSAERGLTTDE